MHSVKIIIENDVQIDDIVGHGIRNLTIRVPFRIYWREKS